MSARCVYHERLGLAYGSGQSLSLAALTDVAASMTRANKSHRVFIDDFLGPAVDMFVDDYKLNLLADDRVGCQLDIEQK